MIGAELAPVLAVVDPDTNALEVLPGGDAGGVADHRNQLPLTPRLDPQHREAAVVAVEGDPLDGPLEMLGG